MAEDNRFTNFDWGYLKATLETLSKETSCVQSKLNTLLDGQREVSEAVIKLTERQNQTDEDSKDFENRLRALEASDRRWAGIVTLISAVLALISFIASRFAH